MSLDCSEACAINLCLIGVMDHWRIGGDLHETTTVNGSAKCMIVLIQDMDVVAMTSRSPAIEKKRPPSDALTPSLCVSNGQQLLLDHMQTGNVRQGSGR